MRRTRVLKAWLAAADSTPANLHYVIDVKANETDAFCQTKSNWYFFIDDDVPGSGSGYSYSGSETLFILSVYAVKSPDFV